MLQQVLIVEDEKAIAQTIIYPLETEGFSYEWTTTCGEALQILENKSIDLIILDVGLPDGNGFEFCKQIRKKLSTPIIFLTARSDEIDKIVGLEIGADDYMTKPFSPRELVSRVKAILRRVGTKKEPAKKSLVFSLNEEGHKISLKEQVLDLSKYEYLLLKIFLERPGWIFSREQLIQRAWTEPESIFDRTVDAHIKSLRKKLKQVSPENDYIETHRGLGYSLVLPS